MKSACLFLCFTAAATIVSCNPKKYIPDEGPLALNFSVSSGFEPSNNRYYESTLPDYRHKHVRNETKPDRKDSKESRFGIIPISTGYGGTANGNGYGTNGVMISPMKIDLGGVALGALLGLGAILIVPKLAHVLSGGLAGYRSLEDEMSSVSDVLARIDNSLEQHNIDSSTCIQRVICTYVNDAGKNINNGEATALDEFIVSLTNNTIFSHVADGTAVKQAVDMGKTGNLENCSPFNARCPITKDTVLKVISSLLPA
ncbi:hypothetical protein NQ315_009866 [Exocentrus adspersus]|uniref:Uncharacterized protein n=1 Tax=Exocentrus adspersus TaxID=1586481 RepID=A0AAV8WHS6_9CUCU|nr:hypothetical protein NQ315_009866 [Exocentrus adspersus]